MAKPIEKFLRKISVQTAVYWGSPVNDGFGGLTFSAPKEIPVRWANSTKLITTATGEEYACIAEVIVNEDVEVNGFLFLGVLAGMTNGEKANPKLKAGAYRIVRFDKAPMIFKTDEFVRTAYI